MLQRNASPGSWRVGEACPPKLSRVTQASSALCRCWHANILMHIVAMRQKLPNPAPFCTQVYAQNRPTLDWPKSWVLGKHLARSWHPATSHSIPVHRQPSPEQKWI